METAYSVLVYLSIIPLAGYLISLMEILFYKSQKLSVYKWYAIFATGSFIIAVPRLILGILLQNEQIVLLWILPFIWLVTSFLGWCEYSYRLNEKNHF